MRRFLDSYFSIFLSLDLLYCFLKLWEKFYIGFFLFGYFLGGQAGLIFSLLYFLSFYVSRFGFKPWRIFRFRFFFSIFTFFLFFSEGESFCFKLLSGDFILYFIYRYT